MSASGLAFEADPHIDQGYNDHAEQVMVGGGTLAPESIMIVWED